MPIQAIGDNFPTAAVFIFGLSGFFTAGYDVSAEFLNYMMVAAESINTDLIEKLSNPIESTRTFYNYTISELHSLSTIFALLGIGIAKIGSMLRGWYQTYKWDGKYTRRDGDDNE
jgi:hypothetical protein